MPVTAPSTTTYRRLSVAFVDDSGDRRSTALRIPSGATAAQIGALITALGAATSANLYEYTVEEVHAAAADASEALDGEQNSVYDNAVILFKDVAAGISQNVFIPAPLETIMDDDTDGIDTSDALYTAVRDAADTLLGGNYTPVSVRYTERREINDRKPA